MLASHVWPLTAATSSTDQLIIGGCNVVDLGRQFGTPLYLLDETTFRHACRTYLTALRHHYPGRGIAAYASKALLNKAVANMALEEGLHFDVSSAGELYVARATGVPANRIHLHGNAKPTTELEMALDAQIGQIVVDNLDELRLLTTLTASRQPPQAISLRLAPGIAADTHAAIQTGQARSKFGFSLSELNTAATLLQEANGLQLTGLHFHLGSQIFDINPYAPAIEVALDHMARLRDQFGFTLTTFSPGGGLGIPYTAEQPEGDIDRIVHLISQAVIAGCDVRRLPLPTLTLEPGRSISGRAGVAVYTVTGRKQIPGQSGPNQADRYIHVDGGMGDNLRPALYGARYTAVLADRVSAPAAGLASISGRYCESGDVLIPDLPFPNAQPGDMIALAAAGAYTLSMANNYNMTLRPAVVLISNGRANLIQRRERYEDLIARDLDN